MATPPLGWIEPTLRTAAQHNADAAVKASLAVRFALPMPPMAAGQKVCLYDAWKHPDVVADAGRPFTRVWQKTGSCVWAGGTCAVLSTIAMQRVAGVSPTKAFVPFTLHNYAMSRHYMGDDRQGEGSLGSTFWKSLTTDGVRDWPADTSDELPDYKIEDDAFSLTAAQEMAWSSYRNPNVAKVVEVSRPHVFAAVGECRTVQDIRAMVLNGYGVSFACNNYIGNGSVRGSGADAYVRGKWDGRGGHQQSIHAVWEHPSDGPLYWAQNNWPSSTYPRDPAGGPTCGVWVAEADVEAAMRLDSEVYGLSRLSWFPAQPAVIDWAKL
jgi:hypothetical protein